MSIYHRVEHPWELPLFLIDRREGSAFFIGHYSYLRWETVRYCIPRERLQPVVRIRWIVPDGTLYVRNRGV